MPALPILPDDVRQLLGIAGITVDFGDDRINVKAYADNPHYYQGQGNVDTITGGLGVDYIEGGKGADNILADLGGSNNTLGYFNSELAVAVTLNALGGFDLLGAGAPLAAMHRAIRSWVVSKTSSVRIPMIR
ncbi:hypothetical protein [Phyllobacterium zundukense]|uniref:Peptidase M10 serralysin C-terminal domain-containing protein n=1 Tax=Phyllobacterium zundukense TaxID=1867719 RepID=A0A2N9W3H6_9HYPH|nr:hypothetical protein [Phyllobacterium zundukense]ATU92226.1 hypothetical protein BLM14_11710 [Phyllobacterium zundukense]PIO46294.1 hypothetical protein B5P45_00345 [Phyllobacterium zundukense]